MKILWSRLNNSNPDLKGRERTPRNIHTCAGIFKQSIEARNQVGIGLSYRPARLHSLAEMVP
jgi:hypothetical protein